MKRIVLLLMALVCLTAPFLSSGGTFVQFRTRLGEIDVELYDQDKPITVQNFLLYVNDGTFTNNMFFHRAVADFIVQGGGIWASNRFTTNVGFWYIPTYPAITNEFAVGPFHSNVYGTIAMAKTSDPNSATSEFFFNLADNSRSLDVVTNAGGFTVFGHVLGNSTNVLNLLNPNTNSTSVKVINEGAPLDSLPIVYSANSTNPTTEDIIYVDVTLLNVHVANAGGAAQISWNSVSNQVNYVEYTTNFPPAWQSLTNLLGNGSATNVTDTAVGSRTRFYRVRVSY